MRRSDIIPIDSRSHLEVADRKHRYAKNLRTYFKEYHRQIGSEGIAEAQNAGSAVVTPSKRWNRYDPFFEWLDNQEALPDLEECPRKLLDEDKVQYLTTDAERFPYEVNLGGSSGDGLWRMCATGELVTTGPKGWIFVLLNERMYACEKRTNSFPRFHHSSFFAGAGVSAAGMVVCVDGRLTKLFPHSGHYRPHDRHLYSLLAYLRDKHVRLAGVQVDVQRVMKLSRQVEKDGVKAKKTECALYMDAETAYNFLRSKHVFHELGVLKQINKLRLMHTSSAEQLLPAAATGEAAVATSGSEKATTGMLKAASSLSVSVGADASQRESGALSIAEQPPRDGASTDQATEKPPAQGNTVAALGGSSASESGVKADSAEGQHTPARRPSRHAPTTAGETEAADVLNMSASTASSTNSPFYSPAAQYQYHGQHHQQSDGHHSSGAGRADHAARLAGSNRSGTPTLPSSAPSSGPVSGSGQASMPSFPQGAITHTTPLRSGLVMSAADSRAKVLGGLLFESSTGGSVQLSGQKASSGGGGGHTGTPRSQLHPASPPISSGGSVGNLKPSAGGGSNTKATIPVPGSIKKVTSHTSICSSLGSNNGYLSQQYLGSARSRSHSKADEMTDYAYDIRVLLADSPSVAPAPADHHYLGGGGYHYGSASSDVNSNTSPITAANSAGNSNCNSRARSRCSSFNQPASSATYANSNFNLPITEVNLLTRLRSSSGADAPPLAVESGNAHSIAIKVGGGYSAGTPSSTEGSPTARQLHQHQRNQSEGSGRFGAARAGSGGKDWPSVRGASDRFIQDAPVPVVSSPYLQQLAMSGKTKIGALDWDTYSPSSSLDTPSGSLLQGSQAQAQGQALLSPASVRSPRQPLAAAIAQLSLDDGDEDQEQQQEGDGTELGAGRLEARSPSPAPSYASSLSSCDSLPHNLLDLLVGGAGAEVGLDDSRGAQSHSHRVR